MQIRKAQTTLNLFPGQTVSEANGDGTFKLTTTLQMKFNKSDDGRTFCVYRSASTFGLIQRLQRTEGFLFGVSGLAVLEILQKKGNLSFLSSFLPLSSEVFSQLFHLCF